MLTHKQFKLWGRLYNFGSGISLLKYVVDLSVFYKRSF